jgi:hypothetical protein
MHEEEKNLSEQESLRLITNMIHKAKSTYHDRGTSAILWGSAVTIASLVTYFQIELDKRLPFDIWLIVLAAIIPQVFLSIRESKERTVRRFEDDAIDAAWMVYGLTIFGLVLYNNIVPGVSQELNKGEGWEMYKHYINSVRPPEPVKPFVLSGYSIYILIYAFPTLVTGVTKKFAPMIFGAILTYALFIVSLFTAGKYDMLCGAVAAIACWLIPGIILRSRYFKQKEANV